jgi:hypothetical protein
MPALVGRPIRNLRVADDSLGGTPERSLLAEVEWRIVASRRIRGAPRAWPDPHNHRSKRKTADQRALPGLRGSG